MARRVRDEEDLVEADTKQARALLKHLSIDTTTPADADAIDALNCAIDALNCANADALAEYARTLQSKGWDYA